MLKHTEIIHILEEAAELAKREREGILHQQLLDLHAEIMELQENDSKLRQENFDLKLQSGKDSSGTLEEELEKGPPEEFRQGNDDGPPYCPRCWDVDKTLQRLAKPPPQISSLGEYMCPRCKRGFGDKT